MGLWAPNCSIQLENSGPSEGGAHELYKGGRAPFRDSFFWGHKRWWMLPMLFTLFLFGALLILAQSSAIAPFIYTLF